MTMQNNKLDDTTTTLESYMRLADVLKMLRVGRTTLYRWIKEGQAPAPIKAGCRISLWRRSDIEIMVRRWEDRQ